MRTKIDRSSWSSRRGSAIGMVAVFIMFVAIAGLATSFQSSTLRRMQGRSYVGFEAVELAESAINEAATQVQFTHVFPTAKFQDMKTFLIAIENEDKAALTSGFSGYTFQFRDVFSGPPPGGSKVGEIFVCMVFPADETSFSTPKTTAIAQANQSFKLLSAVSMKPLAWRRDWAGVQWQNWGVIRYKASVVMDDGRAAVKRTVYADRMFTIPCDYLDPSGNLLPPGQRSNRLQVGFVKSRYNLKTVIQRS